MEEARAAAAAAKASTPPIVLDTAVFIFLRLLYFLLSRRYLLTSISPTLRELQKPDVSPLPTTRPTTRPRSASALSGLSVAGSSIRTGPRTPQDTYQPVPLPSDDDEDTDTPASSYPGSPRSARSLLGAGGETPTGAEAPIEMHLLGAKLRDASGTAPRVIELAGGRAPLPSAVGTKKVKRAARGLSRVARILFSVCFAESMTLITIVIFHAVGLLHAHARRVNFSVSLHILLALVLLVVPLVQCLLCTYRTRRTDSMSTTPSRTSSLSLTSRLLISLIPFSVYIFLFTRIPPYVTAVTAPAPLPATEADAAAATAGVNSTIEDAIVQWSSGREGWEGGGWLESSLGRVVVLGVVVIAGLSGIGAVVTAWDYLEQAAGTKRIVTDADVLQAERSLYRVRHDAMAKRDELDRIAQAAPAEGSSGWMSRVFGTKAEQEASSLQNELKGLEQLESDISRSLSAIKAQHRAQGFRSTLKGTIYNVLGYIFAIYCVARLLMCATSLVSPLSTASVSPSPDETAKGNTNGDWISFVLALAISHLPGDAEIDVASWSRTISLLFTGALVISSLTMVLRWLSRVLRLTSRTVGAGFLLLTLGQLFATYTISLLVQLRSTLPPSAQAGLASDAADMATGTSTGDAADTSDPVALASAALTGLAAAAASADDSLLRSLPDFRVFGRLFDAVFLMAALGTFVYRYIASKVAEDEVAAALGR